MEIYKIEHLRLCLRRQSRVIRLPACSYAKMVVNLSSSRSRSLRQRTHQHVVVIDYHSNRKPQRKNHSGDSFIKRDASCVASVIITPQMQYDHMVQILCKRVGLNGDEY